MIRTENAVLRWLAQRLPRWSGLRTIGNSRFAKSSYFWFLFIPVAARSITAFEAHVLPHIGGANWGHVISLPFSWRVLYLGSLFFAAGTLVFTLGCPPIVRDYIDFRDFDTKGVSPFKLTDWFTGFLYDYPRRDDADMTMNNGQMVALGMFTATAFNQQLEDAIPNDLPDRTNYEDIAGALYDLPIPTERVRDTFQLVFDEADTASERSRITCGICYMLGITALAIVGAQNILFVFRTLL
jgi:hypothetical protein